MDFLIGMAECRIAVITIGLLGNILTFIVFSRPVFAKNSISTYCRALAVFESLTVYQLVADIIFVFYKDFIPQSSDLGCKLVNYFGMLNGSIPGWILIAFSIDKVLSMKNRAKFIKKRSFQYAVISGIVVFHLLIYIEVPIYLVRIVNPNAPAYTIRCDLSTLWFGDIISMVYLIEGTLLPFIIMLCSSIISTKMIRDSAMNIQNHVTQLNDPSRKNRDFKYAITSISFNLMFLLFKTPVIICFFVKSYIPDVSVVTIYWLVLIFHINYSSGFFINLVSNSIFRREFLVLLRFRTPTQTSYHT